MPAFPLQGGSRNTWGTELRSFFERYMNLTTGDQVIDVTYSVLASMVNSSGLAPNARYRITNFRIRHTIPNTTDINEGPVEPLIVTASSVNTLEPIAISETYPQDIIRYELVCTHYWNGNVITGSDRGWIYYREDTLRNNKLPFDFRACKWRRWANPITGYMTDITDPGGSAAFEDVLTFEDYTNVSDNDFSAAGLNEGIILEQVSMFNVVFFAECTNIYSNKCADGFKENTFLSGSIRVNDFGVRFNNSIMRETTYNTFQDNVSINASDINSVVNGCNIGMDNTDLKVIGLMDRITTANSGSGMTYQDVSFLTINSPITNNTLANLTGDGDIWSCIYNTFSDMSENAALIVGQRYSISDRSNMIVVAVTSSTYKFEMPISLPIYADNTAAVAGGLMTGQFYRTSTGQLMIVY